MVTRQVYTVAMANNETPDNDLDTACCESAYGEGTNDIPGREHDGDCDNYDGAPYHQWEVTTPPDVYFTDDMFM